MPTRLGIALVLLTSAAAPAAAQSNPPDANNVRTELEESSGSEDRLIYVINSSSEAIIVTSIRLMECENVQGSCSVVRYHTRIGPASRAMIHRVRARYPDKGSSFRYTFTYTTEAAEGPSAKDVGKDSTALTVDSTIVQPKVLELKVGETLQLNQVLSVKAMNPKGVVLPKVWVFYTLDVGEGFVELSGGRLTGKAPGTAVLAVSASTQPLIPGTKSSRLVVQVVP